MPTKSFVRYGGYKGATSISAAMANGASGVMSSGACSEGFLCAPVARVIFLPQDVHIFLPSMIAVAGGGTNAMDVSKNVRAWRCTRCPARLQAFCPRLGLILLVAWASADVRQVILQQPHARHPSPILEGLVSRYRLARGAFVSCCRSFVFVSSAWLRWCAYGAPARLADSTSWISCFATTRWSVVTLDPGKRQMNILLLVDTTIEGASPSHARQE